ncbi:class I SAM-dependent methyltransferase [bacterium]|nr:class I SAM-dependent methyltransferase [bacterium]
MFEKIKIILTPKYFIKGIKNPRRAFEFLRKDLVFEPEEFIFKITGLSWQQIKDYVKEIKSNKEFNNYIWEKYNQFEKYLIKTKKALNAGGTSKEVGIILYVTMRLLRPEIVLETGVANGISSAYILLALAKNQKGKLVSIDLPYELEKEYPLDYIRNEGKTFIPHGKQPGWLIPENVKKRWELVLGRSSEKFPEVLNKLRKIDIFIHDSEHSYKNMIWEYTTVWPFLNKGGILFSHDVSWNLAFDNFSNKVKRKGVKYRAEFGGIKK